MPLAIACGVASAGFGAWMNLHLWVTYSGDHSLAELGAYFATSLWFDVAHVAGSVVFCLAFGPALVRALARYRTRFEVRWLAVPAAASIALSLVAVAPPRADARPRRADAAAANASVQLPARRPERRRRLGRRAAARARRSSTPAGPRSASPPPAATRSTPASRARSPTSAPTPTSSTTSAS